MLNALIFAAALAAQTSAPLDATCKLDELQPVPCSFIYTTANPPATGIAVIMPGNETLGLVGIIQPAASFDVRAILIRGEKFNASGMCVVRAPTVSCRFGTSPEDLSHTLVVTVD